MVTEVRYHSLDARVVADDVRNTIKARNTEDVGKDRLTKKVSTPAKTLNSPPGGKLKIKVDNPLIEYIAADL